MIYLRYEYECAAHTQRNARELGVLRIVRNNQHIFLMS